MRAGAWIFLLAARAVAAPAVIDASTSHLALAPHLEMFDDLSAQLTLDQVKTAAFVPLTGHLGLHYRYSRDAIWLRVAIENAGEVALERWLVVDAVPVEDIEVFRDGEPPARQGRLQPRSLRELPRRTYSFRLTLAPHQRREVYLRSGGKAEILAIDLWELAALGRHDRTLTTWESLLIGVILAMALYNAFLFFFIGDRSHLYYAGMSLSAVLWLSCVDGSLLDVLPQRFETVPNQVNTTAVMVSCIFVVLFLRRLLNLPAQRRRTDRALLGGLSLVVLVGAAHLLGVIDYRILNFLMQPMVLLLIASYVVVTFMRWRDGVSAARFLALAWSSWLVLLLLGAASTRGTLPIRQGLIPHLAFAFEAVLFSLALADTARQRNREVAEMRNQGELLNQELRRQIADRAGQLATAIQRLSPTPRVLAEGDLIEERYRVMKVLGKGGMGVVYEVERTTDRRRLALKTLTGSADREALVRFAREAQIAAQLGHPNVVSVLDVDVSRSGLLFLVMELVAGSTLSDQRARFGDVKWAEPILRQIAAGLAAMHSRGIVHRDLKPSNVLLDGDTAKVADFGIASLAAPEGDDSTVSLAPLTRTGAFMGTPYYMAPELVHGARDARPSADLWSFGVLAYELMAGRAPFAEPPVIARAHGRPYVPPPRLDGPFGALIERCLLENPDARPTAEAFAA